MFVPLCIVSSTDKFVRLLEITKQIYYIYRVREIHTLYHVNYRQINSSCLNKFELIFQTALFLSMTCMGSNII